MTSCYSKLQMKTPIQHVVVGSSFFSLIKIWDFDHMLVFIIHFVNLHFRWSFHSLFNETHFDRGNFKNSLVNCTLVKILQVFLKPDYFFRTYYAFIPCYQGNWFLWHPKKEKKFFQVFSERAMITLCAWCPLKDQIYLNKSVALSYRFV